MPQAPQDLVKTPPPRRPQVAEQLTVHLGGLPVPCRPLRPGLSQRERRVVGSEMPWELAMEVMMWVGGLREEGGRKWTKGVPGPRNHVLPETGGRLAVL